MQALFIPITNPTSTGSSNSRSQCLVTHEGGKANRTLRYHFCGYKYTHTGRPSALTYLCQLLSTLYFFDFLSSIHLSYLYKCRIHLYTASRSHGLRVLVKLSCCNASSITSLKSAIRFSQCWSVSVIVKPMPAVGAMLFHFARFPTCPRFT